MAWPSLSSRSATATRVERNVLDAVGADLDAGLVQLASSSASASSSEGIPAGCVGQSFRPPTWPATQKTVAVRPLSASSGAAVRATLAQPSSNVMATARAGSVPSRRRAASDGDRERLGADLHEAVELRSEEIRLDAERSRPVLDGVVREDDRRHRRADRASSIAAKYPSTCASSLHSRCHAS